MPDPLNIAFYENLGLQAYKPSTSIRVKKTDINLCLNSIPGTCIFNSIVYRVVYVCTCVYWGTHCTPLPKCVPVLYVHTCGTHRNF